MIHIVNSREMSRYGIEMLTGEACAIGARILCDVTRRGKRIFTEAFGLPEDIKLHDAWNSGTPSDPHIGSIMLAHDCWEILAIIALFQCEECECVITTEVDGLYGYRKGDQEYINKYAFVDDMRRIYGRHFKRSYSKPEASVQPSSGMRNVHGMSGRVH